MPSAHRLWFIAELRESLHPEVHAAMSIFDPLGCSTISFRHLALPEALAVIGDLGFAEIDLGALPGVPSPPAQTPCTASASARSATKPCLTR